MVNNTVVKVTGGMIQWMKWRSSMISDKAVGLHQQGEGETEAVFKSMWASLIWTIWKSSNAQ